MNFSLLNVGAAFAAVGASGQASFGYTAVGMLVPGMALLIASYRRDAQGGRQACHL